MPVELAPEPAGAREAASLGLRRSHRANLTGTRLVGPIPVFDLTLDDISAGRGPAGDSPSGLRYLVADQDGNVTRAVEVVPDGADGYRVAALTTAFAEDTDRTLAEVETTTELADAAVVFELSAVRVRRLQVFALWFRSRSPERAPDRFAVVSHSTPARLLGADAFQQHLAACVPTSGRNDPG